MVRTHEPLSTSRLANQIARATYGAFVRFFGDFRAITRRASGRFAERDWHGLQSDATERQGLYAAQVDSTVAAIRELLGSRLQSRTVWSGSKAVFSGLIDGRPDCELAETFFNSVTRRIFTTVGVDNEIEFVHTDFASPLKADHESIYRTYPLDLPAAELFESILADYQLPWSREALRREAGRAGLLLEQRLAAPDGKPLAGRAEMMRTVFYRGEFAYLVGRLQCGTKITPLALCIQHAAAGCQLDAVLLEADDVSLLFSYTRSYFHVEVERPYELVLFLHSILPEKPWAELYISIGFNRHGKTEFYRDLLAHVSRQAERFELAAGPRGMVMAVFTWPSFPAVLKIIKDRFDEPKTCTRQSVIEHYRLVEKHDRAGRLIDTQEFLFMEFDRAAFRPELLDELLQVAGQTIQVEHDHVVVKHCYVQRRVTPLNLYLQQATEAESLAAVADYGRAIKDLALSNIFPGDLLLKNFGVTRQKRVVFYDYDEVCLLTDCRFRELPPDEDFGPAPSFYAGPQDVFPEEFPHFLGLQAACREVFFEHHSDLFTLDFWRNIQKRLRAGEYFDIPPYSDAKRLDAQLPAACNAEC